MGRASAILNRLPVRLAPWIALGAFTLHWIGSRGGGIGYWLPAPGPPLPASPIPYLAAGMFLHNLLVGIILPWLLERIYPGMGKGFVLVWAARIGWIASPAGLDQGGWYAIWNTPVLFGEFAAYAEAAASGRIRQAVLLLAALSLYEAVVISWVL